MPVPGEQYERIANFHGWLIPQRVVLSFISFGSVFVFIGTILLAIGGPLTIPGAVLLALGLLLVFISLALCLHSCFVYRLRDQETQTSDGVSIALQQKADPDFIPTYAVIDKKPPPSPSSLKNGRNVSSFPKKHVTMAASPDYHSRDRTYPMEYHTIKPDPPPYRYPNQQYNIQNGYANYDYPKTMNTGYNLQPSQPTPYSTLTQKDRIVHQPMKSTAQGQRSTGVKSSYNEDYDNTFDTTPMMSYSSHGSSGQTWRNMSRDDDIPEPQPLVYPSERRPMTFQQTSSSKMSIYDNVQFGLDKIGDE